MATVAVETSVDVPAAQVWAAIADVGAVRARVERGIVEMKAVLESA
ncbi:hypothetical protein [Actinoplanes sp. L3-i22]|nr:hypothetical protein [Actinoplanes sp. L3-i22]BCY14057.1 hypothetical protein L3i22_091450 [Actinoplanes sp. L3-i22]